MSCTFDIPEKETLISGKEYTIKVDKSKITTEDDKYIGDDTAELKFNVDEWKQSVYHQDFSDASLKAKNFTGGTEQDADEGWFEAKDGVGVFNGTPYGYKRVGLPINNQGANRGLVKVKFKFMRPAGATGDPFITIGRERSGSILHVVTLLTINNTSKEAGVLSNSVADDRKLKNGETALTVKDGEWYDYEALIDMDKRTFEAKVTGKGNSDSESRTYTYSSTPMTRDAEDKTNKWTYWPFVTEMNDFMVMNGLIHIDDIDISYSTDLSLTKSDSGFEAKAVAHNTGKNTLLLEQLGETGILKKAYLKQAELGEGQAAVLKQSGAWEGDAAKAKAVIWQDTDNIIPLSKKAEISK